MLMYQETNKCTRSLCCVLLEEDNNCTVPVYRCVCCTSACLTDVTTDVEMFTNSPSNRHDHFGHLLLSVLHFLSGDVTLMYR